MNRIEFSPFGRSDEFTVRLNRHACALILYIILLCSRWLNDTDGKNIWTVDGKPILLYDSRISLIGTYDILCIFIVYREHARLTTYNINVSVMRVTPMRYFIYVTTTNEHQTRWHFKNHFHYTSLVHLTWFAPFVPRRTSHALILWVHIGNARLINSTVLPMRGLCSRRATRSTILYFRIFSFLFILRYQVLTQRITHKKSTHIVYHDIV